MKASQLTILAFLSGLLLSASCKKHVIPPQSELSKLPPATQTGAGTFGCLVNGVAFLPAGHPFSGPITQCNYIYTSGGFNLTVAASNDNDKTALKGIIIGTDSLAVGQGQTFTLNAFKPGNAHASYTLYPTVSEIQYFTNSTFSGKLLITKLDTIKQIVSGTFYFKAVNATGDIVNVTDGRFDMQYTR